MEETKIDFAHILVLTHILVFTCECSRFICLLHVIIDQTCRKCSRSIWIKVTDGAKTVLKICLYEQCTTKLIWPIVSELYRF